MQDDERLKMTRITPKPLPIPVEMSAAPVESSDRPGDPAVPTATPVPSSITETGPNDGNGNGKGSSTNSSERPHPKPSQPSPKLRFECRDLLHAGSEDFFRTTDPSTSLSSAVSTVLQHLYPNPTSDDGRIPPTRSVTLILRSMDGVAYTTGTDLDPDHKEIHLSLNYIQHVATNAPGRIREEVQGVLVHEMVHAWQWNAQGTAPGGLIEGVADFVRLRAGLDPPHWKKGTSDMDAEHDKWDAGYQHTAFFLDWIEREACGAGSVVKINAALQKGKYEEKKFWRGLFGRSVLDLWKEYKAARKAARKQDGTIAAEDKEGKETGPSIDTDVHKNGENFWAYVSKRRGPEQMIVLKAVWRTARHGTLERSHDTRALETELQDLWSEFNKDS